jgi:hypothetical protein
MYSPIKDINNNVRMGVNKKKHIIYGKRIIKSFPNNVSGRDSYKDHSRQSKSENHFD